MAILNSVVSWFMKKRMHQIDLFMKYPSEVQSEWFKRLINTAKSTEWGKKYDYSSIRSVETFKERVPVNRYEDLKPFIEELRSGRQNILWPSDIKYFAISSGTTSDKSKFIPVSMEALEECHYKGGKDMLALYCNNFPNTSMFDGRGLGIGGSQKITEVKNASIIEGDLSAILIDNLPIWVEFIRVPKKRTALMNEWESKIERMAEETIGHNVTSLSGVPSWLLLLLKRILEKTGRDNILEVWPYLEVYFHGGVNFAPYRSQFDKLIPSDNMKYMETYNASEGFFGIQDLHDRDDMLLMLDYGIYYEFIPFTEIDEEHPKSLSLDEVETGVNYAMVISTNAGLWRYMIGDTVEFTSLEPYRIRITGRTRNFINAFGEELIVDNAEKAIDSACQKNDCSISEYTAAPMYFGDNSSASHEWFIEFETPPSNLDYFTEVLDNALKSLNSDYEAKRYNDLILQKPVIHVVPNGTFYKWLKQKGKLGGQNKVPRLSNNRNHVDEIKKIIQVDTKSH
jgi:hypothetical protein